MDRNTLLDLIPAYTLGALDPDERAEVEARLSDDPEARRLLAEYQEVTDRLLLTVPARPAPPHLSDDLRRRLKAMPPEAVHPKRPILRPAWLVPLVAAAAILIVALAALLRPTTTDPAQLYAQIAAASNSQHFAVVPGASGSLIGGELVATSDDKQAVLHLAQLPPLDPNQTFQLWLMTDSGLSSGGLFRSTSGDIYVVIPLDKPLDDYQAFAVSVEPTGGSPYPDHPTGSPILSVSVRA